MGRGDFYSDLSERNREAFSSFSVSQDCLSLFLFLSSCLHRLPLFCFFLCVFIASLLISSPLSPVPTPYLLCLPFCEGLGPAKSFLKLFDFVASLSLLLSLCTHRLSLFLSWCTSRFNRLFFFYFFL